MKNFKKILPAIALAGAGIIAAAGAGNASAYNYAQLNGYHNGTYSADIDPANFPICYTISGVTVPQSATTMTFTIQRTSSSIDLSKVGPTSANDTTYTASSNSQATFTVPFTATDLNASQSSVTKCAHLNFYNYNSNNAMALDAAFDTHSITVTNIVSSNNSVPAATLNSSNNTISFGYQLSTNANDEPTTSAGGSYQAEYWSKTIPTYSSTLSIPKGHVKITKRVKGHAADPAPANSGNDTPAGFQFKARVYKLSSTITGTGYYITVVSSDNSSKVYDTCEFASSSSDSSKDCTFYMKHGDTAYIGCSSASCNNGGQLLQNGFGYTITETDKHGHTSYLDVNGTLTAGDSVSGTVDATEKSHAFVNQKTNPIAGRFFNLLPFIILAALATVGVVTLRKANKKNEA